MFIGTSEFRNRPTYQIQDISSRFQKDNNLGCGRVRAFPGHPGGAAGPGRRSRSSASPDSQELGDALLYWTTLRSIIRLENQKVMTYGARREVFVFVPSGYEYLPGSDESVGAAAAAPALCLTS